MTRLAAPLYGTDTAQTSRTRGSFRRWVGTPRNRRTSHDQESERGIDKRQSNALPSRAACCSAGGPCKPRLIRTFFGCAFSAICA